MQLQNKKVKELQKLLDKLRSEFPNRVVLDIVSSQGEKTFVATIGERGFAGKHRKILLKNIRVFGIPLVIEEHLWVNYDKKWKKLEPFFQGQDVVLYGVTKVYARADGSEDFNIDLEKVLKL